MTPDSSQSRKHTSPAKEHHNKARIDRIRAPGAIAKALKISLASVYILGAGSRLIAEPLDGSPAGFLSAGQGVRYRSKFRRRWSRRSAAVFDPTATFEDRAYMLDPDFPLGCYPLLLRAMREIG
jgi:hypothetical protein